MLNKIPIKYRSEEAVKKALKIDTFRNLSKDKVMQFASMIPYMNPEVAIAVINQFPVFADFGKTAISYYMQISDTILANNKESQAAAIKGYQTILDALSVRINNEGVSDEERKSITEDMITVADKIAEADYQNKKFLLKVGKYMVAGVLGVAALVGGAIGVSSMFGGTDGLPQLENDNNDDIGG